MANTKKYVSLAKLGLYDEKIKKYLADADAVVLQGAKDYADGLAGNYEAAGSVNTAKEALQKNIDAAQSAADAAGAAAAAAQGEVDALETYVGTFTASEGVDTVVKYIDKKTEGIASEGAMTELAGRVTTAEGAIDAIEADYLKAADKTELSDAIGAEASRADAAEKANAAAIKAISDDYLKASDKESLQGSIDGVAEDVAAIEADYLKAADKTELSGAITAEADRAKGVEAGLRTDVDAIKADYLKATDKTELSNSIAAEAERAAGVEESLQTQINTIMNNPDTEGVINSINEFTAYIEEHGEIAEGFRTDIDANAEAIETLEADVAANYQTKEDATAAHDALSAEIAAKAVQADWSQNDESAADYVKNRTHYEDVAYLLENFGLSSIKEGSQGMGSVEYPAGVTVDTTSFVDGDTYYLECGGETYTSTVVNGRLGFDGVKLPTDSSTNWPMQINVNATNLVIGDAFASNHDWAGMTLTIYSGSIKQLDEKFIPDTIARVSDIEAADTTLKNELEGKINAKADASALTEAVEALEGADADIIERVAAVEAQLGDGEGSVSDMIAEAKQEAIDAAALAAEGKDTALEAKITEAYKKYADDEDAKIELRVDALETASAKHALASDLTNAVGRISANETAIAGHGTRLDAVEAKASANETAIAGLNTAVGTKAAQSDLTAVGNRVTAIETWHADFVECSEEEINGLFA